MPELLMIAFLFLKTGEKFATQTAAGPTVAAFTSYVADKIGGVKIEPQVLNEPARAVEFVSNKKPALGIVTPGFFLAYKDALKMEPLLEVQRQDVPAERFVIVVKKSAGDDLTGKVIATTLAAEEHFITGVVLQNKFGDEVRLKPVTDVESAIFDVADAAKNAADAVLVEESAWQVFAKDEELGPKLKVAYRSDELPGQLLVAFTPNAGALDLSKVKETLKAMSASAAGKEVLASIRVQAFTDVNQAQLAKVQALYYAK